MLDRAIEAQNAAIEAPNTKPDSDEMREYEAFLFMFANTLLHEIAHVLTTYLTRGKLDTPANMPSEVSISPEAAGEAGFDIEYSVFGGVMYYQHDPDHVTPNDTVCSYMVALVRGQPFETYADVCCSAERLMYKGKTREFIESS